MTGVGKIASINRPTRTQSFTGRSSGIVNAIATSQLLSASESCVSRRGVNLCPFAGISPIPSSNKRLDMRTWLLGFLLSPILLLAQSPISRTGEVTVGSLDVTSGSAVSSEHLLQITLEIESHSYPPSQLEEVAERARYLLQREG